jgi:photosystem II stability/assembly factor-like uncharacterized protein
MGNFVRVFLSVLFFSPIFFSQSISWQQLSGPHGGAIYSIVSDNSGNIYTNTVWGAGPFKSTDDGESWFSIKNGLTPNQYEFHPLNINSNGDLFIGNEHNTAALCRSTDGGSSWEPLNNLNLGSSIICIAFDANDNVYVGTGIGIYKSTDNGDNWSQYGMTGSQTESIAFNDSGHVFAGTSYAVYRSKDDGANWTQLPTGGGTRTVSVAPNGYVFAGCWENGGILRSTNNGDTWSYSYPQTVQVKFASTVFYDGNNNIYFPTYGKGVLKSTDSGDSWAELNDGLGYKYVRVIASSGVSNSMFTGGDYALYKYDFNSSVWNSVGLPIAGVSKIIIPDDNNIYAAVWGVNRSTDFGLTWQTINNGLEFLDITSLTENSNGYLFASARRTGTFDPAGIYRSSNQGEVWESVFSSNATMNLASGPNGEIVAVGAQLSNFIQISIDDGLTWEDISYGMVGANAAAINSLGDIFIINSTVVWRKLANDTVWTICSGSSCGSYYALFIANNGYIYTEYTRSTDNGDTWTTNNAPTFLTSYAENSQGHLFVGTSNSGQGVYRSTDYAETWEQINTGLPIMDIRSVAVDAQDYLYAGSWGMSMFKTTTSTFVSVEDIEFKPTSFSLEQNYPNPFNPSTKISWQSQVGNWQTLKVYDVLGNEVATLVDEYKAAGKYDIEFDATGLNSGVYFYQLRAGSFVETKKMILLK